MSEYIGQLDVVINGRIIGHITRPRPGAEAVFDYTDDYVANGKTPISTRIPITTTTTRWKTLHPFLEGLLPEDPATRRRWADNRSLTVDDSLGIINYFGWDCPGAIQITDRDRVAAMLERPSGLVPLTPSDIEDRIRLLRNDRASWTKEGEHWSLAGQQEKFALALRDGIWHTAEGSAPTTHIFKPGIGRLHHQALVEHLTMTAARNIGLDVAETQLVDFGNERVIVIERFDRYQSPNGHLARIHQEDMAQATGVLPANKYETHHGPGLERMAQVLNQHAQRPEVELKLLADFAIINYVAGAPDGHAKNVSIQLVEDDVILAPQYDLATEFPYDLRGTYGFREVAVSIGGRRKLGQVLGKHWDRGARQIGVAPEWMRSRVKAIAENYPDAFATALAEVDDPAALMVAERALDRMGGHSKDVLSRLDDAPDAPSVKRKRNTTDLS